ncbi:hypothetical protein [Heterosigma akashiwo virus 01]|jgi:hypothetical protein|uniref:Uncharacterized protein n=1 Tax=Heterosigma akashiwo virus 01 TaxID=97195 RepID=A0A1C9C561_HAV01|nr:hypothetical protein D1R72_gp099 [Heterosigma akashiwo virus 01]AOM63430.1 hypothetical protein [Heterosigma akashiwo virus 01]
MNRQFWDIDEEQKYNVYMYNNKQYKVLKDNIETVRIQNVKLLAFIDLNLKVYKTILNEMKDDLKIKYRYLLPGICIYINTPHEIMEINGKHFNGLNKPKNIYERERTLPVGKDGIFRAERRVIMLKLFRDPVRLFNLVVHELAHTFANHVKYREDDHGKDFKMYERFIKKTLIQYLDFKNSLIEFMNIKNYEL